ncbi:MAG: proton extrusion protein PcxA [Coleofasciculaceae cyanobacterium RL_1_1]|nr:proton extrusion protein PcxA [Coleofasciculaceae cyanobacterium RL_1_1]
MNSSNRSRGILAPLYNLHRWYCKTPERALDAAYVAAQKIEQIEQRYFDGQPIPRRSAQYTSLELGQFRAEVDRLLNDIRGRLTEFNASRSTLNFLNERSLPAIPLEASDASGYEYSPDDRYTPDYDFAEILDRLRFIDTVLKRYRDLDRPVTVTTSAVPPSSFLSIDGKPGTSSTGIPRPRADGSKEVESLAGSASLLPRSILRTLDRVRRELDPEAEEDVVAKFRDSKSKTVISLKFILTLILIPLLVHQVSKNLIIKPIYENFWEEKTSVFINKDFEEEAFMELHHYEEMLQFQAMIGRAPALSDEEREQVVQAKALEIAEEFESRSGNAVENVFSDLFSLFSFCIVLIASRREVEIVKSFIDDLVYGLSDSAKAFIIILFTDIFVGYHSPHGWEVVLEGVFNHFGLAENRQFNFLFIATFPVILDTVMKYWIFRYLNRISPSAVATYRNMNE